MTAIDRVTVSLPHDLVQDMDRWEKNRSKFVAEAVRNELERRRRAELRFSLANPHPESVEPDLERLGLNDWAPEDETAALVNGAGEAVRWVAGEGWTRESD